MAERTDVVVIGGGVIGVCTAHSLALRGARVALLERGEICSGCSYGNAGWIFPSHSAPLAAPGVVRQSLRWLLDRESPLYIKPRLDPQLARWLLHFRAACNESALRRSFELNRELSLASRARYARLAELPDLSFGYAHEGLLVLCRTADALRETEGEIELLAELGGDGKLLSLAEAHELAPAAASDLAGGARFEADAHLDPAEFVRGLARVAEGRGVVLHTRSEVMAIETAQKPLRVIATGGEVACDAVVVAAGAWTPALLAPLGVRIPVQAAKGYSVTVRRPAIAGTTPIMLSEAKVGVTPMRDTLRFAGTLELAGLDLAMNARRVGAILSAVERYLPGLGRLERIETWRGLRPLTPDGLPILGRAPGASSVIIAGGHGMSGMSQGPISGELLAQLVSGEPPGFDLAPFSPGRFG